MAIAAVLTLLALATTWADRQLGRRLRPDQERLELIYLPPTRFLRAVSLGYTHVLADVLWFRTISYFGKHHRGDRIYPWLARMCDAVTDLDPRAEHVYRFGGVILPWEADRVDDGIALLEKGARNIPDSWRLQYMLGFSYYFFEDDLVAASQALQTATLLPDAEPFVGKLAAVVSAAERGPDSAIDFLQAVDRVDPNNEMRSVIQQRIRELSLTRDIDALNAAVQEYVARFHRSPTNLTQLVSAGLIATIPPEPFGGRYVLDPGRGQIRSSLGHQPVRLGSSQLRESFLKGKRHRE